MWRRPYASLAAGILCAAALYVEMVWAFFGASVNRIFPCEQQIGNSFPCFGIYDIWFALGLAVLTLLLFGWASIVFYRYRDLRPHKPTLVVCVVVLLCVVCAEALLVRPDGRPYQGNDASLISATPVAAGSFLPDPSPLPAGWYVHRFTPTSLLITQHAQLPDIQAEGYAYGDQVVVTLSTTTLEPHAWAAKQGWLDDAALVHERTWTELHGHPVLQVRHDTEALPAFTAYLFVNELVYSMMLYPYPGSKALGVFNELEDRYTADRTHPAISAEELAANCAKEIPPGVDDTAVDLQTGVVTFFMLDDHQKSVRLSVPYSPATDFAGCSESIKAQLRHISEFQKNTAEGI